MIHFLKKDLFEFCRGNGKRRKRGKWLYMITQQETLIVVFLCTTYSDARYNDKYICISHMKQLNATIFISERTEQYSQNGFHIYLPSSILPLPSQNIHLLCSLNINPRFPETLVFSGDFCVRCRVVKCFLPIKPKFVNTKLNIPKGH